MRQQRHVAALQRSADRVLGLVNDVMNYTQAMGDSGLAMLEPCYLFELCAASVRTAGPKAAKKRQKIALDVNPLDLRILNDGDGIMAILNALLDNAIKFTPEAGQVGVDVVVREESNAVEMAVWDTGLGITPEQLPYLFQPFRQIDQVLARKFEGLGLGLAFVRRKVEILGGSVVVDSQDGGGSRFIVTLPANRQGGS